MSEEELVLHCPLCGEFMLRDYRNPRWWWCPACEGEFREPEPVDPAVSSQEIRACFLEDTKRGVRTGGGKSGARKRRKPPPKKPAPKYTLA